MPEIFEKNSLDMEKSAQTSGNIAKFLTFISDGLHFGVNTDNVIEIITDLTIRPFPMVPNYVMGVINLRGQVVPIIDMRLRVGKLYREYDHETCIIVLELENDTIGIVVDSVAQVIDINMDEIALIPTENRQELTNYMISDENGTVIMLLECEAIVK